MYKALFFVIITTLFSCTSSPSFWRCDNFSKDANFSRLIYHHPDSSLFTLEFLAPDQKLHGYCNFFTRTPSSSASPFFLIHGQKYYLFRPNTSQQRLYLNDKTAEKLLKALENHEEVFLNFEGEKIKIDVKDFMQVFTIWKNNNHYPIF